ncbi:MAG: hypothetical protein K0U98_06395 [Deltaproteobacteria bacterium]|nr:hypothetical protein [Deltaproteobacteria bacterium]
MRRGRAVGRAPRGLGGAAVHSTTTRGGPELGGDDPGALRNRSGNHEIAA